MTKRYTPEQHAFLRSFIPGHSTCEIRDAFLEKFGISMTISTIKSYKSNHGIWSGVGRGVPRGLPTKLYPAEVMEYIRENYKGVGPTEMAARLNAEFGTTYTAGQIGSYYVNRGISSGLTGRFEKGCTPFNKGKTIEEICRFDPEKLARVRSSQFPKGHEPANKMPIGTVCVKTDGYLWKKIGEGSREWKQVHIMLWEEANGPVPDGMRLTFKDGDRRNVDLANLALVTPAENAVLTTKKLRSEAYAQDDIGLNIAKAYTAIKEAKKRK